MTSASRQHLVMAAGTYNVTHDYTIGTNTTSAPSLFIHGGGATLENHDSEGGLRIQDVPVTMRDITIIGPTALTTFTAPVVAERVKIKSDYAGVAPGLDLTMRDFSIDVGPIGYPIGFAYPSDKLTLERGIVHGGQGIIVRATLNATNVLFYGFQSTAFTAKDDGSAHGKLQFCTIADAGATATSGVAGVQCIDESIGGFQIESTIVWTPNSTLPPVSNCAGTNSIVGPVKVGGIITADPKFVDEANGNYHLSAGSPAIDMVNAGPSLDFEGDPRPQGARFDIGADEAK